MFSFVTGSTSGVTQANVDKVIAIVEAAAEYWSWYIDDSLANITISIDFVELSGSTLATGGTDFYFDHSAGGLTYYAPMTITELQTGVDQNGANADIVIQVDIGSLNSGGFYLTPPVDGVSVGLPGNLIDLFTVIVHEIGHGLGFVSFLDEGGTDRSTFDDEVLFTGGNYYFTGAMAVAKFGDNVPLASEPSHTRQNLGLIMSPQISDGVQLFLTEQDIAIFGDIGAPLRTPTAGADTLHGFMQSDNVFLDDGDDLYYGLRGNDTIDGGNGNDTLYGGDGNDSLYGGNGQNWLDGGDGSDRLTGGSDADTLIGGVGSDTLDGGDGEDTVSYETSMSGVSVNLALSATSGGDAQSDFLNNFENLTGSAFNDTLTGDAGDNQFIGGAGADALDGGDGEDAASYAGSAAGVTVNLATGMGSGGEAAGDTLSNIERIIGSAFNDVLTGDGGDNALFGGQGSDYLIGGAGGDVLDGGDGIDVADYGGSSVGVAIDLEAGTASGGDAAGDVLTAIERLVGSSKDDALFGDGENNALTGGLGADDLRGRDGDDFLYGGDGYGLTPGGASIMRLYEATLDRPPDLVGFANWTNALDGGQDLVEIADGFVNSMEFQTVYGALTDEEFVTLLYNNVLDRAPDMDGFNNWVNALSSGTSRADVVVGFSQSIEFQNATFFDNLAFATTFLYGEAPRQIFRLYQATLDRAPDAEGFINWMSNFVGGMDILTATSGFVTSAEFQTVYGSLDDEEFVTLLYNNVLDRAPDSEGLSNWLAFLDGGGTREQVVNGFAESFEFVTATKDAIDLYMKQTLPGVDDTLAGGAGDDDLFGGFGADRFDFSALEGGSDQVYGFDGFDSLGYADFGYADQAEALTHFTEVGMDLLFSDQGVDIFFHNTTLATIQNADFYLS